ncbi:lysozyme inhibitor LprI family protein [Sinorhizobium numidicum]|uniref:Lysozyme inhibitor LprI family protein n=1 Tax=Sinorhizobium numidicum TaxID=680248 RepID=A0ABY8CZR4_9HYPH|nr:lysozyme inhibitor LprI family protein [Sinorhizobium numidicum]WEX76194.1 lysozyme inhibitor LprI family protein [Sinorhizobium numidicum]WEX82853.1 lysozyme inhibitor LprI family protein [Sinorhizobium numidicum]
MKKTERFSVMLAIFLASVAAMMVPAFSDDLYDKCIAKVSDNASFAQCGSQWVKREDDKLNATWKTVFAETSGQTRTDMLAEQRLWNAYKESACAFYANGDWGREGQVLDFLACRAGVIAARTKNLDDYGAFFKGDN